MPDKLEIIAGQDVLKAGGAKRSLPSAWRNLAEVSVVFALIMATVWTPQGRWNALFSLSAAACVVGFAIAGRWGSREMGLTRPWPGIGQIFLVGLLLCGLIWVVGLTLRSAGPTYPIPWNRSWQYAIWAVVQQFILQSIFFVRLESTFGSRRAVLFTTGLYTIAHIPNLLLTVLSFFGGLIFCELFRRWRNLFPIGIIHAALGLTIACSFADKWLHHMRVGIGYLTLR